jgi:hypothetical protein
MSSTSYESSVNTSRGAELASLDAQSQFQAATYTAETHNFHQRHAIGSTSRGSIKLVSQYFRHSGANVAVDRPFETPTATIA